MADRSVPSVSTIPAHAGFADALVNGLWDRHAKDPLGLARGTILLPNSRARRTVQEAFVRRSENGLLLPRLAVIGDLDLDDALGLTFDASLDRAADIPRAVTPLERLLFVAKAIGAERPQLSSGEALRLAREFTRTLDQLIAQERSWRDLTEIDVDAQLAGHWQKSKRFFEIIARRWEDACAASGWIDEATRRNALFDATADKWRRTPPNGFVVAAGITANAPAIARLLRVVAFLPQGEVVLPDLDLVMPDEEWRELGPFPAAPDDEQAKRRDHETHPQYHLKLLLDRMSIARGEVTRWRRVSDDAALSNRSRALSNVFAIPKNTGRWNDLPNRDRSLAGVRVLEVRTSADEAQNVAVLARQALEEPERRVAIVTPDRVLAARISAKLARWGIAANDTAGQPLSTTPTGVFFLTMIGTVTSGFPPADLLALLKHPLTNPFADTDEDRGPRRRGWLTDVRRFDLLIRGPRSRPGLAGYDATVKSHRESSKRAVEWWEETRALFASPAALSQQAASIRDVVGAARALADRLTSGAVWSGPQGQALSELVAELEAADIANDMDLELAELPNWFEAILSDIAVRPPYGGHPRITIYGLIEARLQQSDLTICCGLNEGTWPQAMTPDPWLSPMVRKTLGLPALERQIGLEAHDLVATMGSANVVLTRSARAEGGPAIASRFLLRMQAMCGSNLAQESEARALARALDRPARFVTIDRPAPRPSAEQRRVSVSVTGAEQLRADPFAFYASKIMRLKGWEAVDAEPGPSWKGSVVHEMLYEWAVKDDYDPDALARRTEAFLSDRSTHPLLRTLWAPRLTEGLHWVGEQVAKQRAKGREPILAEQKGEAEVGGWQVNARADRIDRLPDGTFAVVDYKTGSAPSNRAVKEGFRLQLGLIGAIIDGGGYDGLTGSTRAFEYWSLAKNKDGSFGRVQSPDKGKEASRVEAEEVAALAASVFRQLVDDYILGDEPMMAKLHPEYAPYEDYNQLMRLEEWYGRDTPGLERAP